MTKYGNVQGVEKLNKFFGMPITFESVVTLAPQPRHVKEYKMKKIFGEEIPIERRGAYKKYIETKNRAKKKFIQICQFRCQ